MSLDAGAVARALERRGGAPHGAAFLADEQTAGRGRGGHRWHSPPGSNIYLSLLLRPQLPLAAAASITLACGLAVAAVVERALVDDAGAGAGAGARGAADAVALKWPNDVLAGGRKIAGVLVEAQLRGDAIQSLIIGVGLNVAERSFPPEIAERATSLALLGVDAPREELAADLIASLGEVVARFEADHFAPFAGELARRDWLRGRRVRVGEVSGIAAGIDAEGRLLVEGDDGVLHPVVSGEVSVVLGPT